MIHEFNEMLRVLRRKRGLTQEAAARLMMIDRSLLGHMETGEREPDLSVLFRMSTIYEVHPFSLIIPLLSEEDVEENPYLSSYKKNSM